jgi:speckle-type POZ protein
MSFVGVSFAGDADGSAAATTPVTYSGYHLLVVRGYSRTKETPTGECIESRQFRVGAYRWRIEYYPNGHDTEDSGYIAFFLALDQSHVAEPVTVEYGFSFVGKDQKLDTTSLIDEGATLDFASTPRWVEVEPRLSHQNRNLREIKAPD